MLTPRRLLITMPVGQTGSSDIMQLLTVLTLLMMAQAEMAPFYIGECYKSVMRCYLYSVKDPTCYERYLFCLHFRDKMDFSYANARANTLYTISMENQFEMNPPGKHVREINNPLKPHFYIEKLGYAGVHLFFLFFALKQIVGTLNLCVLHWQVFVMCPQFYPRGHLKGLLTLVKTVCSVVFTFTHHKMILLGFHI